MQENIGAIYVVFKIYLLRFWLENDSSLMYFYSQKTALHLCIEYDQVEVFRLLLAANANVDARDVEYE